MITRFTFTEGSERIVPANIRAVFPRVVTALTEKITWWMLRLQQKVQGDKLQGQVLEHRTGKLTASIIAQPTEQDGSRLIGSVTGAGGPAWYGQLHEDGGTYDVKEYVRRTGFNSKGEIMRLLTKSGVVRKSVAATKEAIVRAHTVTFPQRAFMAPSLEEIEEPMVADLQNTASTAASQTP